MAEQDECEGCAKVRRHPGEGYICAVHPNFVVVPVQFPAAVTRATSSTAALSNLGHVPLVNATRTMIVGCTCGLFQPRTTDTDTEHAEHVTTALAAGFPYLDDPGVDYPIFRAANHDLVTIFGELDESDPDDVHTSGWRLWCMTCGLKGERLYQDIDQARRIAGGLRNRSEPRCKR